MNGIVKSGAIFSLMAAATACSCASTSGAAAAPEPAKPIEAARFYIGRWYEIGRTPMNLTKGCVAGTTDYYRDATGQLIDRDACRQKTPEGKEKVFSGPVKMLNKDSTKIRVKYKFLSVFNIPKVYWMLDHGDDYRWFIVSDPGFNDLSLFTRSPRPSRQEVAALTERAAALGYDTKKLEYPTQFPPGEGDAVSH